MLQALFAVEDFCREAELLGEFGRRNKLSKRKFPNAFVEFANLSRMRSRGSRNEIDVHLR